jgi:hypothetical protein
LSNLNQQPATASTIAISLKRTSGRVTKEKYKDEQTEQHMLLIPERTMSEGKLLPF